MENIPFVLGELNYSDLKWLVETGCPENIPIGAVLIAEGQPVDQFYVVLGGTLEVSAENSKTDRSKGQPQRITQLAAGEPMGILSFINGRPSPTTVTAIAPSQVLAIPYPKLTTKLKQDRGFAARFYQAIAVALANQLRAISGLLVQSRTVISQPLRQVLLVFGELYDGDIDWMATVGNSLKTSAGTMLIREGEFVDALYILLEGSLSVSVSVVVDGRPISKEIAKLASGEIIGEMSFVSAQPPSATVQAVESCFVLALPRQKLTDKLQHDQGFAARFYRALSVVLVDRLEDRLVRHGYGKLAYDKNQPLDEDTEYEDELDADLLDHVSLAGVRFNWLRKRMGSNH